MLTANMCYGGMCICTCLTGGCVYVQCTCLTGGCVYVHVLQGNVYMYMSYRGMCICTCLTGDVYAFLQYHSDARHNECVFASLCKLKFTPRANLSSPLVQTCSSPCANVFAASCDYDLCLVRSHSPSHTNASAASCDFICCRVRSRMPPL